MNLVMGVYTKTRNHRKNLPKKKQQPTEK